MTQDSGVREVERGGAVQFQLTDRGLQGAVCNRWIDTAAPTESNLSNGG